jgi:hypothetical protein
MGVPSSNKNQILYTDENYVDKTKLDSKIVRFVLKTKQDFRHEANDPH